MRVQKAQPPTIVARHLIGPIRPAARFHGREQKQASSTIANQKRTIIFDMAPNPEKYASTTSSVPLPSLALALTHTLSLLQSLSLPRRSIGTCGTHGTCKMLSPMALHDPFFFFLVCVCLKGLKGLLSSYGSELSFLFFSWDPT